ncbi:MAG: SRPBCC family protein [Acidobacteria bacterium]|nr:SRPBCC family protein [Acidobacteriota bacterium]
MVRIALPPADLPVPPDRLFAFLADASAHRAFLEPDALDFTGDADGHRYKLEVMGMRLPLDMKVQERVAPARVVLVAGEKKAFDQSLRFDIESDGNGGSRLRMADEADFPMMFAMMGAEKLLQGQLERSLGRIVELAAAGKI